MSPPFTPSQTAGPLFGFSLVFDGCENAVDPDGPGAWLLEGRLTDGEDRPLEWEGLVEFWSGDQFARARTGEDGRFRVVVGKPPSPRTPAGVLLAPHLNVTVFGRGLGTHLNTRMYFPDEGEANARDPVLALLDPLRRATLLADAGNEPSTLRFNIRLQGPHETVFFAL